MYNTIDEFVSQKIRDIEHCRERIREIYQQLEKSKIDTIAIKQIIEEREEGLSSEDISYNKKRYLDWIKEE